MKICVRADSLPSGEDGNKKTVHIPPNPCRRDKFFNLFRKIFKINDSARIK